MENYDRHGGSLNFFLVTFVLYRVCVNKTHTGLKRKSAVSSLWYKVLSFQYDF